MPRLHCLALVAAAFASVGPIPVLAEQEQAIASVFRSGVETVRSRIVQSNRGRAPKRLVKEDFEIKQNGVVQSIDVFDVFVLSPTRVCYEIGFSSTTPPSVKTRTVEIKIRGYSKHFKSSYTLPEEGRSNADPNGPRMGGSCTSATSVLRGPLL